MPTIHIKFPQGATVPSTLTLVEGNQLRVKLEKVPKTYKLGAKVDAPTVMASQPPKHNDRADSWQFDFVARQAGLTKIAIVAIQGAGLSIMPAAISVQVQAPIALPAENTTEGMLVRLLLAENLSPDGAPRGVAWKASDILTSMRWMRRVIENRLKSGKPEDFMARGATTIADIIKANDRGSVQFHGFPTYPKLSKDMQDNLADYLQIANNGLHGKRAAYQQFVQAAITAASEPLAADPTSTGLFAWRSEGSGSPGPDFKLHASLMGNTFYTHARLRKQD